MLALMQRDQIAEVVPENSKFLLSSWIPDQFSLIMKAHAVEKWQGTKISIFVKFMMKNFSSGGQIR